MCSFHGPSSGRMNETALPRSTAGLDRLPDLFAAALEMPDEKRQALLTAECAGNAPLRGEVESLLAAHAASGGFLLGLDSGRAAALIEYADETASQGDRGVGPYRLLRELGRGGMGVVYLAERAEGGFEQRVALKLVKRGMDSEAILRRFLAERQILAGLSHPHIARLLDGGLTEEGQPFFAMEYVEGEPLLEYCAARGLDIEERLALFEQACRAVEYAHGRLVVHRDLKPSNLLVTAEREVKLLDFGVAKLLAPGGDGQATALTEAGLRPMTPAYAAPEQVRAEPVTTATDVYALGVLLYELLCGRRPYGNEATSDEALAAAICTVEPEPPSRAVTGPGASSAAQQIRSTEAAAAGASVPGRRLAQRLAGDLDTIVLTALKKEPERRYASVAALHEDLRRHRSGLPILARPDTGGYRAGTFVRRHRWGVAAAAALVAALLAGIAGTAWQARVAARERDQARRQAAKAAQVAGFLSGIFELSDPERSKGEALTARDLLERGAAEIESELAEQPELQAEMMMLIGEVYLQLGLYAEARPLFEKAHATRRAVLGEESSATAESLRKSGLALHQAGDFAAARRRLEAARDAFERLGDNLGLAAASSDLGNVLRATGDLAGSRALHERSVALKELHDPESASLAKSLNNLGLVLQRQGELEEAERVYRRALGLQERTSGADSIVVAGALDNLASAVREAGRPAEALPIASRGLAILERILGEHRRVATALNTLGGVAADGGDYALARSYYERAIAIYEKVLGPEHPETAFPIHNLGHCYLETGEPERALPLYERALAIRLESLGSEHIDVAGSLRALAGARAAMGELEAALELYARSLATYRKSVPPDHPRISETLLRHGRLLAEHGRCAAARPLLEEALALRRTQLPPQDAGIVEVEEAGRPCAG